MADLMIAKMRDDHRLSTFLLGIMNQTNSLDRPIHAGRIMKIAKAITEDKSAHSVDLDCIPVIVLLINR